MGTWRELRAAGSCLTTAVKRAYNYHLLVTMRIALNVSGVLCLLVGCVWILQGINILPGSFMTGQTKWAIYGGLLVVVGIGLLISANRRPV